MTTSTTSRTTAAVLVAGVGALVLAGCGASTPTAAGSTTAAAPPTTTTTTAPAPTTSATTAPTTGDPAGCTTDELALTLGAASGSGQQQVPLVYTNRSGTTCTLSGYPGLDLRGPDDPTHGPTYTVARQQVATTTVTLAPGDSTTATLTVSTGGDWTPTEVASIPPGGTQALTVAWPAGLGAVSRQDGATHPGTYVGPFQAG